MLAATWAVSDKGRRAKFYSLTANGRKHLAAEAASWHHLSGAIALVMRTT
jgi:DNA-binding PadR family transcriptional regulator